MSAPSVCTEDKNVTELKWGIQILSMPREAAVFQLHAPPHTLVLGHWNKTECFSAALGSVFYSFPYIHIWICLSRDNVTFSFSQSVQCGRWRNDALASGSVSYQLTGAVTGRLAAVRPPRGQLQDFSITEANTVNITGDGSRCGAAV